MTSKVVVSGKHALTVRVDEEVYRDMRRVAAELNCSVNEMIVRMATKETRKVLQEMKRKE